MDDGRLLRQYANQEAGQGSQAAFSALVARHLDFVYSVCRREVGDAALAEDVTQVVFLLLARKAPALRPGDSLTGWLFQTARFAARNARRRESVRRTREQEAGLEMLHQTGQADDALWDRISPTLNDALASLAGKDRKAVLLRFADGLSFPELGAALGTSEDAARMRLNRAVDRLRRFLAKTGVVVSSTGLVGLMADRTAQAAPAACKAAVAKIVGSAGGAAAISPHVYSQLQGALKAMTMTKRYATIVAVLITGSAGIVFNNLRQAPAQASGASREDQDTKSISDPLSPDPAVRNAVQQRHTERAMLLRDLWQPWAENHHVLLKQMLQAQPSDAGALARVYEAIPASPGRGSRRGEAGISNDDLHTPGALFTWNAGEKHLQSPSDPATAERLTESNAWFSNRMRQDFGKYHDFRLTESVSTGRYHTVLWASGRVTIVAERDRFVGHGKPFEDYEEIQAEVSPAYDFLQ